MAPESQPVWEAARVCVGQMRLGEQEFGEWLYLSPACTAVVGLAPEVWQTEPSLWRSHIHPEDWEAVVVPALPELRAGQAVTLAYRFQHGNGIWRWLQQTFSPVGVGVYAVVTQDIGEVQDLRHRLSCAEQQAQAMVEAVADGLLVIDAEGTVVYANPAAQEWWQEDLQGKPWGMPLTSGALERMGSGCIRYADVQVSPMVWGDRPAHLITLRDITDRRRIEQDLQARIQQEQASLQVTQAIRRSLNLQEIFDTATAEIGRLLGVDMVHVTRYLPAEDGWQHVSEYRANADLPSFLEAAIPNAANPIAAQLLQGHTVQIADTTAVTDPIHAPLAALGGAWLVVPLTVDGRLWGGLSCRCCRRPHVWQRTEVDLVHRLADPLAIAIQQAELYERVQRELAHSRAIAQSLQEKETLFRGIVENAGEVIFVLNREGRFTYVSPSWQTVVGHPPVAVLDRHFAEFVHPEDLEICTTAFTQLQQHEQTRLKVGPYRVQQHDGSYRWHESSVSSVLDAHGHLVQAIGVARDVEEQQQYAQALQAAKEAAEAASRAKSNFLAVMSHELRTPMNAVLGFAQLLQTTPLSPEQQEYVTAIVEGGNLLVEVIRDILDLSRAEADRLELVAEPFSLRNAVADVVRLLQPKAIDKNLQLSLEMAPHLPSQVLGDAARFQQILMNLLGNALKFTETGQVTVQVTGDRREDGRWEVQIAVQDTGIGIDRDRQAGLFEPFYQGDSSIVRRFGGSGLGLAICKRLCEKMQGSIAVESVLGQGSTFRVRLPLPEAPAATAGRSAKDLAWEPAAAPLRILVAEDNRTNQRLISLVLKRLGHTADLAEDGREVVLAWQRQPYDLILMDVRMPNVDGLTATRQIRNQPDRPQPWIVGFSGDALTETQEEAIAAGMDDYLIKPLDIGKLAMVLQQVAKGRAPTIQG